VKVLFLNELKFLLDILLLKLYNNVVQKKEVFKIMIHTTYSQARANLASLMTTASDDKEIVLINRRNAEDVALISSSELSSLMETAHLLRSPENARRLLTSLNRALSGTELVTTLSSFKKEIGFE